MPECAVVSSAPQRIAKDLLEEQAIPSQGPENPSVIKLFGSLQVNSQGASAVSPVLP